MRHHTVSTARSDRDHRTPQAGGARVPLLALAAFLLGLGGGALLFHRGAGSPETETAPGQGIALSDSTKAVLAQLESPVAIRFYAVLDPANVAPALRDYAGRVNQLLAEYQQASGGRIQVTNRQSLSDATAAAASADGLKPFNLEKGEACYLGIAVAGKNRKELLTSLSPQWEPALEYDISRAIARVAGASAAPLVPKAVASNELAAIEEVRRLIPDLGSVSIEEGAQRLRQKSLAEFSTITQEMEKRIAQAEQRFLEAESNRVEAAQQAASKELQQLRAEQADKLRQVAARLSDQIAALEKLKKK
jgi:hypothetical protein